MSPVELILAGVAVGAAVTFGRAMLHLQRIAEHRAIMHAAYKIGEAVGVEMHAFGGPIPGWPKVCGEFQPWQPKRMRVWQNEYSAQVAFARGRHDGWHYAARQDILDGAEALLRGE